MTEKNEFLKLLMEDIAVLHNLCIKNASHYKQVHDILLGAENALQSGAYEDLSDDEFKEMIKKDIEDISRLW